MKKYLIPLFMLSCALHLPAQEKLLSGTSIVLDSIHENTGMGYTKPLVDFRDKPLPQCHDAEVKRTSKDFCTISLGHKAQTPSVAFPIDKEVDLNNFVTIALDIKNEGSKRIAIEAQCYADKDTTLTMADGALFYYRGMLILEPGETDTMLLYLSRPLENRPQVLRDNFDGMYGIPGGFIRRSRNLNLSDISHIGIFKQNDGQDAFVTVGNIRVLGRYEWNGAQRVATDFFPFIDSFGQYKHSDWSGKTHSAEDMYRQREAEERELAAHPSPAGWNRYGGWAQGPTLAATGHFRVEKYKGKWWLVDPEGKLFWSQGLNIVTVAQHTRIKGRESYFSEVPNDFYRNNLKIKYQEEKDLFRKTTDQVYRRLRSWGMNTIAANSNTHFYREGRMPYTIEIRSGLPHSLPEDFDAEAFKVSFQKVLTEKYHIEESADDPWCIGYFIDNEYAWPKKNQEKAIYDYFRAVREVLNEFAPKKLYLGCRSNSLNFNRIAFEAAARYCDVISINHYDYNVSTFKETEGLDKPLMIGEFHFGALDRGLPHTGLRAASNQRQRARLFEHFVSQALESDDVVGVHWFQYLDQPYTARSDGENYQIGFVDICDRPYPEMIEASRKISGTMYSHRLNEIQH